MHATQHTETQAPAKSRIDEVFLTPRVLDRRSYDELSGSLRELIERAEGEGQTLESASQTVRSLRDGLRESTEELQGKIRAAAKVLPTFDERVRTAEELLRDATARLDAVRETETRVNEELQARIDRFGARLEEMLSDAERRIAEVEQHAADRVAAGEARIEDVVRRLETGLGETAADAERRVESAKSGLEEALGTSGERAAEMQERFEAQSDAAMGVIDQAARDAAATVASSVRPAMEEVGTLAERVDEVRARVERVQDGVPIDALVSLCDQAYALLGTEPGSESEANSGPGTLASIVERAEAARRGLQVVEERVVEVVEAQVKRQAELSEAIVEAEKASASTNRKAGAARKKLDASAQTADEVIASISRRATEELDRAKTISGELIGAIERSVAAARETAARLDRGVSEHRELAEELESLAKRLESAKGGLGPTPGDDEPGDDGGSARRRFKPIIDTH
ncbi:MAG: hypothetical protein AAGG07_00205 [Planctomycetota bacterium]